MQRVIHWNVVPLLLLVGLLAPGMASAGAVYLNGANITGVTNQTFKNCSVEIDAHGNVHIKAKGYAVRGAGGAAPESAPPATLAVGGPVTKKYFLVTEKAAPGMSQYDIELFINGKWVRKFLDSEQHVVMEVSKYLQAGQNKIRFLAKKNLGAAGRRSTSPTHYFRVVIGQGDSGGRNVMITRKLVDYKRTALETKDYSNEFTVTAN